MSAPRRVQVMAAASAARSIQACICSTETVANRLSSAPAPAKAASSVAETVSPAPTVSATVTGGGFC